MAAIRFRVVARRVCLSLLAVLSLAAAFVIASSEYIPNQAPLPQLTALVDVHIIQGLVVTRGDTPLSNWITRAQVDEAIPAINEIWRQAAITWQVSRIDEIDVSDFDLADEWARMGAAVHRFSPSSDVRQKRRFLRKVGDRLAGSDVRFHIFIVPYHGWTTAGESVWGSKGKQYVFLSAWVDDTAILASNPRAPYLPLKAASFSNSQNNFARTAAHELGHAVALLHNTCERDCLMGGTISSGDRLTPYQIKKARSRIEPPGPFTPLYDALETLWLWAKWGDPR